MIYSYIPHSNGYYVGYKKHGSIEFTVLADCTTEQQAQREVARLVDAARRLSEWVKFDMKCRGII